MSAPGTSTLDGLTSAQVAERVAAGHVNTVPERTSRSYGEIVRSNVFTRFNAIIAALAGVVLAVGEPFDALFAGVMVLNTVIGIVQEARAKQTLDGLRVLVAPTFRVRRDGDVTDVGAGDLVLDDIVLLAAGDQVPVDAVVLAEEGLEVDESALTGEADPVAKDVDDEVRSGSAVVAGSAEVRATRVGDDAWVHRLVAEAKEFVLTRSELRLGVDRILQVVSWIIAPLAALLVWSQLRASDDDVAEALVSAVAGVVALVPQGLVLLVSMAMAVAILRLARNHVVVQELYAVEGLARVDVICLDKTGTLTTGRLALEEIEPLGTSDGERGSIEAAVAALAAAEASPTSTMQLLASSLGSGPAWEPTVRVAFSSARKWSGTTFAGQGSWVLGAPEILIDSMTSGDQATLEPVRARVEELAALAKRVLLLARCDDVLADDGQLPATLSPAGLVVLAEDIRGDAADTMRYFAEQHVVVKVISGDNPVTVSAVATALGVPGGDHAVDMREIGDDLDESTFDRLVADATVFGRVRPEQKQALVLALKRAGHTVAMTGDGVNDIPALKKADIGIAMDTATSATKAVSQLVLLDGRFDRMPMVVAEGRRVIANMERVSALFITKTVYATIFALVVGITAVEFPFLPRHLSVIDALTIGVPAFALSFRAADQPSRPGYLRRVLRFAVPAGVATGAATLVTYALVRSRWVDLPLEEARTAATMTIVLTALWVLVRLVWPVDRFEAVLLAAMLAGYVVVLAIPWLSDLFELHLPTGEAIVVVAGSVLLGAVLLQVGLTWSQRWQRQREHLDTARG
jgi:cation-transporting ATPase E